jgi:PAS domain S-box-containing protein
MYTILYVDDEPALLELGKTFLEQSGSINVVAACSAKEAILALKATAFDCIIADYQMPEMDGLELLKFLRGENNWIPFILFTGRGREEVVIEAVNSGVDYYLQKGGDPKAQFVELEHKIILAIQYRNTEDELKESRQRMTDIIDHLPDATFAIDLDGKVIAWNRAMEEMTGVRKEEILGTGDHSYALPFYGMRRPILLDLVLRDDKETERKYPHITRKDKKLISEIYIPILYGGKGAYLWFIASPLYDTHGNITGAIESIRDITDRKTASDELRAAYEQITAAEEELHQQYDEQKKSGDALRESEENYRALFDGAADLIAVVDAHGTILNLNRKFVEESGYQREELIGKNVLTSGLVTAPSAAKIAFHLGQFFLGKTPPLFEIDGIAKDGTIVPLEIRAAPVIKQGEVTAVQAILRDLRDRRSAEKAISESRTRLEEIVRGSPIPQFVIDKDHRVISWNRALEEYSGVNAGDVLGTTHAWKAFYDQKRPVLADLLVDNEITKIQDWYSGKFNPSKYVDGAFEATDFFPKMGKTGIWLHFTASALRDPEGNIVGAVETLENITERKKAEEELRASYEQITASDEELRQQYDELKRSGDALLESERKFRAIFDQTFQFTGLMTLDGTLIEANRSALKFSGIKESEIIGKPFWETPWWRHSEELQEKLRAAVKDAAKGEFVRFEATHRSGDGSLHYVDFSLKPVKDKAGHVVLLIPEGRDITERKIFENRIIRLSALKEELLATASLEAQLKLVSDAVVEIFDADFARIWLTLDADLCDHGCIHALVTDGPDVCRNRDRCLHLMVSSGRYTHTDGNHRRVPLGCYKIGRVASGEDQYFITNDVTHDSRVHDHTWAEELGLVSFAGFRLLSADQKPTGVLALFRKTAILPQEENLLVDLANTLSHVINKGIADAALNESEERYRSILDNIQDVYYRSDTKGNLIQVSPSAAQLLESESVSEILGKNIAQDFYYDPIERSKLLAELTSRGSVTDYEVTLKKRDGTPVHVSTSSHKYYDKFGNFLGVEGLFRDITERKKYEEELTRSRDYLDKIFSSVQAGIMVIDAVSHEIIDINPGALRMIGLKKEEITGRVCHRYICPAESGRCPITDLGQTVDNSEKILLNAAGEPIPIIKYVTRTNIYGRDCLLETFIDNSERKRAEEELIAANDQLAASSEELKAQFNELVEIDRRIRESEEKYRSLVDNLNVGVYRNTAEFPGRWLWVNPAFVRILGYDSFEEFQQHPVVDIYTNPEERKKIIQLLQTEGFVRDYELQLKKKDGTYIWVSITAQAKKNPDGTIKWIDGICEDITALKNAEEIARRYQFEMSRAIDYLPDATFVINPQGTVIAWNRAIEEMTGVAAKDIIGRGDYEYALPFYGHRRPVLIDLIFAPEDELKKGEYVEIKRTGKTLSVETQSPTLKGRSAVLRGIAAPIFDESGNVAGAIETITDITELKRVQEDLMGSENRYRTIFNTTGTAIVLFEGDTIISMANAEFERLSGYSREELEGKKSWTEFIIKEDLERMLAQHRMRRERPEAAMKHYEFRGVTKSGEIRNIFLTIDVIPGTKQSVASLIDMTDTARAEDAIKLANKKLNLLNNITRHDILNQLTGLFGYLELVRERLDDPLTISYLEQQKKAADMIKDQIEFTRDYQDIGVYSPEWQKVQETIYRSVASLHRTDITLSVDCGDVEIFADLLLEKVFYTLAENAIRHGETVTKIQFSVKETQETLKIICKDNGRGVPKEAKEKIFKREYFQNTGLGLFLTREILGITGITITETGIFGKWARFEILVPKGTYRFSPANNKNK